MFELEFSVGGFTRVVIDGDVYLGVTGQRHAQKNGDREYE